MFKPTGPAAQLPVLVWFVLLPTLSSLTSLPAYAATAESDSCATGEPLAALGTNYTRYIPSASVAPVGSEIIQFTYSQEFLTSRYSGDTVALHNDLDAFAYKLCDEIDNPMGIQKSDIALLHDLYYVTEYRPYEFGDSWFSQAVNGGTKFRLDQGSLYKKEVLGQSVSVSTADAYDHIDIFLEAPPGFNYYGHPFVLESDLNDESSNPTRITTGNAIVLRKVPKAPDWSFYPVVIHELGHLFDITAYGRPGENNKRGFGQEPRAQLGRRYVGITNSVHGGFGTPFNQCFYRHEERDPFFTGLQEKVAFDYNPNTRGDAHGESMWAYMAEHFHGTSATSVADDLAAEFITKTYFEPSGERVANTYLSSLAELLEASAYADQVAYPYFFDGGAALNGEDRLGVMWRNMTVAIAANAPNEDVGQYGFPFEYDPPFQWNYFQPTTPGSNAREIPAEVQVTSADYGSVRSIASPFSMPDASQYTSQVHPWNMEVFVLDIDPAADIDQDREIAVTLNGTGEPYSHPTLDYRHEVYATVVSYRDIGGDSVHDADDKIIAIDHLDAQVLSGDLVLTGAVPTYLGARKAMIIVTMVEKGLPIVYDSTHPLYNQPEVPWVFSVEYELRDRTLPTPEVSMQNKSADTGLSYSGQPYASISFDADGDGDHDLMIANQIAQSNMYRNIGVFNGVPVFSEYPNSRWEGGSALPQIALHGLAAADYDNDGDMDFFAAADSDPRLYRNDGTGSFDDVAPELGVATLAQNSWCGAWQDYDGDGFVDLFVGRGLTLQTDPTPSGTAELENRLLKSVRNDQLLVTSFADVSAAAGIDQDPSELDFTPSAAWADFDGDGDPDLAVARLIDRLPGGPGGDPQNGSHIYVNQGDGTFVESAGAVFNGAFWWNSSLVWTDFDGDADFDLVGTGQVTGYVGTRVFLQDAGELTYASEDIGLGRREALKDVRAMDVDLDGAMDLVSIPEASTVAPRLYLQDRAAPALAVYDAGVTVGLEAAVTSGIAMEDWNDDGDADVFLGRAANVSQKKFFYRTATAGGADALANQWAGVELIGGAGNNVHAIGATVVLKKDGVASQVMVVDGGSGRGGQSSGILRFGLGDNAGSPSLSAEVTWPNGWTQTQALTAGSVTLIEDGTPATVVPGSASFSYTPQMNGKNTWNFVWKTEYLTRITKDRVTVNQTSGGSGSWSLDKADSNVTVKVTKIAGGYRHEVTATDMTCVPMGSYNFTVRSETDFQSANGAQKSFMTKICAMSL